MGHLGTDTADGDQLGEQGIGIVGEEAEKLEGILPYGQIGINLHLLVHLDPGKVPGVQEDPVAHSLGIHQAEIRSNMVHPSGNESNHRILSRSSCSRMKFSPVMPMARASATSSGLGFSSIWSNFCTI